MCVRLFIAGPSQDGLKLVPVKQLLSTNEVMYLCPSPPPLPLCFAGAALCGCWRGQDPPHRGRAHAAVRCAGVEEQCMGWRLGMPSRHKGAQADCKPRLQGHPSLRGMRGAAPPRMPRSLVQHEMPLSAPTAIKTCRPCGVDQPPQQPARREGCGAHQQRADSRAQT